MAKKPKGSKDPTPAKESVKKRPKVSIEEVEDEHHETLRSHKEKHTLSDDGPIIEEITSSDTLRNDEKVKYQKDETTSSQPNQTDLNEPSRARSLPDDEVRKSRPRDTIKRPKITKETLRLGESSPTIHSSKETKRDRFGDKDPFGFREASHRRNDERQSAI